MEVVELQIPSSIPQIELPQQLITSEILPRLPIKSLTRFKAVSKEWKSIISNPEFARLHLHFKRSSPNYSPKLFCQLKAADQHISSFCVFDYSAYEKGGSPLYEIDHLCGASNDLIAYVWGCSNGLVLLGFRDDSGCYVSCYVWNPATQESRMIPYPTSFSKNTRWRTWGFGYVSSLDDYKIVCLYLPSGFVDYDCKYETKAFTLSLKSGTWKQVSFLDGFDHCLWVKGGDGVLVDEMLYWLFDTSNNKKCIIVGFDLASEKFIELDAPNLAEKDLNQHLSVIGGCLCFCSLVFSVRDKVEISMLKVDGGSTSWVKFYSFYQPFGIEVEYLCVRGGLWSGRFIMWTSSECIGLIDINQDPLQCTTIWKWDAGWLTYLEYYEESLVSPFSPSVL